MTTPDVAAPAPLELDVATPAPVDRASPRAQARLDGVVAACVRRLNDAVARVEAGIGTPTPQRAEDRARRALHLALATRLCPNLPADLAQRCGREVVSLLGDAPPREPVAASEVALCTATTGLLWPELPGARSAWARALVGLDRTGAARARVDGTPVDGDASALAAWLETALLFARLARAEGVAVPTPLQGAAGAVAWHLYVRGAPSGTLPPGDLEPVLAAPSLLLPTARSATVALGWGMGEVPELPDGGALARFFGGVAEQAGKPLGDADWSMWTWGEGRTSVLHLVPPKGRRARVVVDGGSPRPPGVMPAPELEVDGLCVLDRGAAVLRPQDGLAAAPDGVVQVVAARVDVSTGRQSRKARIALDVPGPRGAIRREVLIRQARVIVEDTLPGGGAWSTRWAFAPGWKVVQDGKQWRLEHESSKPVKIELDERFTWKADPGARGEALVGEGSIEPNSEDPLRVSLEWT